MTVNRHSPLEAALADLLDEPPTPLADRIFVDWTRARSRFGPIDVAFNRHGVVFVRTAESEQDDAEFREAFRHEFEQPLRRAGREPTGMLTALRRNRTRSIRVDLRHLPDFDQEVLQATRLIPAGQTRPSAWVAREVGRPERAPAVDVVLARNPVPVVVPCHRVTLGEGGEHVFGARAQDRMLRSEDVNVDEVRELAESGVHYLGSDTTNIVCFPTCHNARRISAAHRRGFGTVEAAERAGYRPCGHCRPVELVS
ncbi:methylated-DNA--[protein]-cysteine S-methyltransferase [Saccharopolyspora erythraea]|uniref:methylated-DNA--[protein]-cysteine S-methyltransferase n=1 Tax=Saccharopolyspora erythraea TaxID=1836 RepID=UPI001BA79DEC|nr:methylated-DNA--[protein]-cysteine S-methyltransferase [Saccharopolyspora erythraea]QUH03153.1 methylated-DNA--[protein]-cysteine S-methyltransferase [Saccharopolyspora erythraea]